MINQPLLTVIVPVYKVEKYLSKCLDSIINQSYRNLEIICVNDGSPDNCGKILDTYKQIDNRIVVLTTENGGLSHARNIGLSYAKSRWAYRKSTSNDGLEEYLTFVDSDDYLDLDTYTCVMEHFSNNIDLVSFGYRTVDASGFYIDNIAPNSAGLHSLTHVNEDLICCIVHSVWSKVFRKDIVFLENIFFPDGVIYEDLFFTSAYLAHSNDIWFDSRCYYSYLIRKDSIMGDTHVDKSGKVINYIRIIEHLYKYLFDHNLLIEKNRLFWNLFYKCIKSAVNYSANDDESNVVYDEARRLINKVPQIDKSVLFSHYNELICNKNLHELQCYKLFSLLKIKHRPDFDKYYLLGVPYCKVSYFHEFKRLDLFLMIPIKL